MDEIVFKAVQPVLPSKNVAESIAYYVSKLGFELAFQDNKDTPKYAGVRRDSIELHFQWHDAKEWEAVERPMLRFVVGNLDSLYKEFSAKNVFHENTKLQETAWGTKEFAFYDLYFNGLVFYEDL